MDCLKTEKTFRHVLPDINYLDSNPNFRKTLKTSFYQHSWIDSFIYGNVYIVGLRLAFSESDLWWLLNRKRLQENQNGRVTIFVNQKDRMTKAEEQMFKAFKVNVILDQTPEEECNDAFFSDYFRDIYMSRSTRRSAYRTETIHTKVGNKAIFGDCSYEKTPLMAFFHMNNVYYRTIPPKNRYNL